MSPRGLRAAVILAVVMLGLFTLGCAVLSAVVR